MTPTASRYSGPPPKTPTSLGDAPPHLNDEQLQIPTSELYAASLSAAWSELSSSSTDFSSRPTPERVEALEPHPSRSDRPQPEHFGPYADVRKSLDWSYHVVPSRERQRLQDEIVGYVLSQRVKECKNAGDDEPCQVSETSDGEGDDCRENGVSEQRDGSGHGVEVGGGKLALFTAGGMGAGKGHTLRELLKTRRIRLPANTVWIDPDALSRLLPERPLYLASNPSTASALLHPEASLLQEICAAVARKEGRSLVVDGSLTDCGWFEGFMKEFGDEGYGCEILFVSAPEETMLRRAEKRAKTTGRVTNPEAIKRSRVKSPECVTRLSRPGVVRRVRLIDNSSDSSSSIPSGPITLYDSLLDPAWPSSASSHPHGASEGCHCADGREGQAKVWVDAKGFVEGRLEQGEDGRVKQREKSREKEREERL